MLDWCIKSKKEIDAGYILPLPPLSKEEEEVVEKLSDEFRELSKHRSASQTSQNTEILKEFFKSYCKRSNIYIDEEQEKYLLEYLKANTFGLCGLEFLLNDDTIEEIGIIGVEKPVQVYKVGIGWQSTNLLFRNEEGVVDLINKIGRSLGRRITYQTPRLNATFPDGSRLHASIPPISNVEMTIRKFKKMPISIGDLIKFKTYSADAIAFLSAVFQSDFNVIIAGNTASGKTSTLNALFSFVPLNERILIIEETPEINIPHPHLIKMLSNADLHIDMQALVHDSLRMRPDRVIVGEVRTAEEVKSLIETILSGQARGSYATFHAQSAEEVIKRMVSLGILQMDLSAIDFIIIQRRITCYDRQTRRHWEERKGIEIVEVVGEKPDLISLFSYDPHTDTMKNTIERSQKLDEIATSFSLSREKMMEEIQWRAELFSSMAHEKMAFEDSIRKIQKQLFNLDVEKVTQSSPTAKRRKTSHEIHEIETQR